MLTKRIIACLDVNAGRVVKGVQFVDLRDAGDPAELAKAHSDSGADEIVLLDISAAHENRSTLLDTVQRAARQLFIPFTVGGGIRTLDDAASVFYAGADKISINSAALANPELITQIAQRFGSQAVVVAIDAKRCVNRDGTGAGFDCELTRAVADTIRIPVIASGGAGGSAHFVEVFREGHADAALAASIFHYGFSRLADLKQDLGSHGIPVRWPC
jgi:cyclase